MSMTVVAMNERKPECIFLFAMVAYLASILSRPPTPFKWRFADGPMVVRFACLLARCCCNNYR